MADRLTQLQDCLDDLLMQMFATLNYIQTHHPYGQIAGQPDQTPGLTASEEGVRVERADSLPKVDNSVRPLESHSGAQATTIKQEPLTPSPDAADTFNEALRELAREVVIQEQKAELLINSLPGIGSTEQDQRRRMHTLEGELKQLSALRTSAEHEKTQMLRDLDRLIIGLRRISLHQRCLHDCETIMAMQECHIDLWRLCLNNNNSSSSSSSRQLILQTIVLAHPCRLASAVIVIRSEPSAGLSSCMIGNA